MSTIAVDFDGTLCENRWPEIGEEKKTVTDYIRKRKQQGDRIILWTCRDGDLLTAAEKWCAEREIELDAINQSLPEVIERFGSDSRKITADVYLDDKAMTLDMIPQNEEKEKVRGMRFERTAVVRDAGFTARSAEDGKYIEGYFAKFGSRYELWPGAAETIDRGAFHLDRDTDVRVLVNHDTSMVLGRTTAGTATLRVDDVGLWGSVLINEKDQDALNCWARTERRDVTQCSFGFDVLEELTEYGPNGSVVWHLRDVKLYEVSVCTFPAYEDTNVQARKAELADIRKRKRDAWAAETLARLKGEKT